MQGAGLSLADMLATVHPLLASCLACGEEHAESFRTLRLVSREISCTVQRSARKCSMQLGKKACLPPAQVVRLMKDSQLEHLNVTIITTPGGPVLSLKHVCIPLPYLLRCMKAAGLSVGIAGLCMLPFCACLPCTQS